MRRKRERQPLHLRLTRHLRESAATMQLLVREPRKAPSLLRAALVRLWRARGGGFYGLGVVVTFVVLEVRTFVENIGAATSVVSFITEQLLEFIFRLAWNSLLNGLIALAWPILLLDQIGGAGLIVLAVGFGGWAWLVQPRIEKWIPELKLQPEAERTTTPDAPEQHSGAKR